MRVYQFRHFGTLFSRLVYSEILGLVLRSSPKLSGVLTKESVGERRRMVGVAGLEPATSAPHASALANYATPRQNRDFSISA